MVSEMPLVSVVMPSYNHERFISETIGSVLGQSFKDFELIIIDDASKDNSKQIIEGFCERENRVNAIFHKENMGIARTLNDGIEKAKGKFIALIGSDDVWSKDKLKKQVEILEKNEDLVVWSEGKIIDAHGNPTGELFTEMHGASKKKKSGDIFDELLKGNFIFGSSLIYKRGNTGDLMFNETLKYLNDYQFEVDLAAKYEYFFILEPLVMYRIHGGNTILSDRESWQKDRLMVNDYFLHKYSNRISNKMKSRFFLSSSLVFSNIGEKAKAMQYMIRAIKLNPFYLWNIYYLVFISTNKNGVISNFLRRSFERVLILIAR